MSCAHLWKEAAVVTPTTSKVVCEHCGVSGYAKARQAGNDYAFTVAAERVCSILQDLVQAHSGVKINAPRVWLSQPLGHAWRHGERSYADTGPWQTWASITRDIGPHYVIAHHHSPPEARWPVWLYHFDRWVARLDGWGGNNLLMKHDGEIVPIDWGCAFGWAVGCYFARRVNDLDIPCHPGVANAASETVRGAIKQLSDAVIWRAVLDSAVPTELCPSALLAAYWSGLCARRDLL